MFLTGIGIFVSIFSAFYDKAGTETPAYGQMLLVVGLYVILSIFLLCAIQGYRSQNMHRVRYILDVIDEK